MVRTRPSRNSRNGSSRGSPVQRSERFSETVRARPRGVWRKFLFRDARGASDSADERARTRARARVPEASIDGHAPPRSLRASPARRCAPLRQPRRASRRRRAVRGGDADPGRPIPRAFPRDDARVSHLHRALVARGGALTLRRGPARGHVALAQGAMVALRRRPRRGPATVPPGPRPRATPTSRLRVPPGRVRRRPRPPHRRRPAEPLRVAVRPRAPRPGDCRPRARAHHPPPVPRRRALRPERGRTFRPEPRLRPRRSPIRDVLAFVVVARWLGRRGERRATIARRQGSTTTDRTVSRTPPAFVDGDVPRPRRRAAWRAALDAAPRADPSLDRLVDWTLTATVARNVAYDRDQDSNPLARVGDLVASLLAGPPRRPPGVGWPEHAPAPEWDEDDDHPEGFSGGTASTWDDDHPEGVSEDGQNEASANGWTTSTTSLGTTSTTGTTRSTMVARRDVASSEERALMRDDASLATTLAVAARSTSPRVAPRVSRLGGWLTRARVGNVRRPRGRGRMLGDWAETPHFEPRPCDCFLREPSTTPRGAEVRKGCRNGCRPVVPRARRFRRRRRRARRNRTARRRRRRCRRDGRPPRNRSDARGYAGGTTRPGTNRPGTNRPGESSHSARRARSRYYRRALRGSRRGRGYPDAGAEPRGRQSRTRMVD